MKQIIFILLVVFALSVISGLVIAKDDPLEQARKEQDEKLQTARADFIQSTVTYYSIHSGHPWFTKKENGVDCARNSSQLITVPMNTLQDCIKVLQEESSLQDDFLTAKQLSSLYVTNPNPQTGAKLDIIICFQPQSKLWQKDSNTRYAKDGKVIQGNTCKSQGGTQSCYSCTQ